MRMVLSTPQARWLQAPNRRSDPGPFSQTMRWRQSTSTSLIGRGVGHETEGLEIRAFRRVCVIISMASISMATNLRAVTALQHRMQLPQSGILCGYTLVVMDGDEIAHNVQTRYVCTCFSDVSHTTKVSPRANAGLAAGVKILRSYQISPLAYQPCLTQQLSQLFVDEIVLCHASLKAPSPATEPCRIKTFCINILQFEISSAHVLNCDAHPQVCFAGLVCGDGNNRSGSAGSTLVRPRHWGDFGLVQSVSINSPFQSLKFG